VPHEPSVFSGDVGRQLIGEGAGVEDIACVSNLVAGGWKAKGLGMPPQCSVRPLRVPEALAG